MIVMVKCFVYIQMYPYNQYFSFFYSVMKYKVKHYCVSVNETLLQEVNICIQIGILCNVFKLNVSYAVVLKMDTIVGKRIKYCINHEYVQRWFF